jgi:putative proteasome-type protease
LISLDSTIRSNSSVGLPVDLLLYPNDSLNFANQRRFRAGDPDLQSIHQHWEQSLRRAVQELPAIDFECKRSED